MNKTLVFIIVFIACMIFGYFAMAFAELDFDFHRWKDWARSVLAVWFLVSLVLAQWNVTY